MHRQRLYLVRHGGPDGERATWTEKSLLLAPTNEIEARSRPIATADNETKRIWTDGVAFGARHDIFQFPSTSL